jgi:hypothetical protein
MEKIKNIKRCSYRNCNKAIDDRANKKFCCDSHRKQENTYLSRENKRKKKFVEMLIKAKELTEQPQTIIGLFEKIYGNK